MTLPDGDASSVRSSMLVRTEGAAHRPDQCHRTRFVGPIIDRLDSNHESRPVIATLITTIGGGSVRHPRSGPHAPTGPCRPASSHHADARGGTRLEDGHDPTASRDRSPVWGRDTRSVPHSRAVRRRRGLRGPGCRGRGESRPRDGGGRSWSGTRRVFDTEAFRFIVGGLVDRRDRAPGDTRGRSKA